jgi:hypothetical protein
MLSVPKTQTCPELVSGRPSISQKLQKSLQSSVRRKKLKGAKHKKLCQTQEKN